MKRSLVFIAVLSIIACGAIQTQRTTAAKAGTKHKAVVEFIDPVQLLNVTLKGSYLIVHDDELMARGQACTFVYSLKDESKLVVSFHCIPVERKKVATFTFRTALAPDGKTIELREIQFGGDTEAHQVPMNMPMQTAVVNLVRE